MASRNFTNLARALARAQINFESDAFKAVLVTAAPDETAFDSWTARSQITGEHAATGGYAAGGFGVTATVGALDAANNRQDVTFAPAATPSYSNSTLSALGCIIYKSTGVAANDIPVCFIDFGGTVSSVNGNFSVTFSTPLRIAA